MDFRLLSWIYCQSCLQTHLSAIFHSQSQVVHCEKISICKIYSMHGQQINLKWKSFHSTILDSFESMLAEEGLVDVTLATEGRCLKAHKVVLSASSPFFRSIFQMNPCQHPVIVFHDINYSELESILKFVYKGEVNIYQKNLPLLLRAAETLQIRGLCRQLEHEYNAQEQEFSETQRNESHERLVSEKFSGEKTPPSSPKNVKKIKSNHSYKPSNSPPPPQRDSPSELSVPVCPVIKDEEIYEPRPSSPDISDEKCDNQAESSDASQQEIIDTDGDENELSESANDYTFDLDETSNFPFPPFPCPFCDRAYTRWGFRRRHIKACHTRSQSLPCKWCLEVLPSHTDWESHVCLKHSLSRSDARNGLLILEEAEVVLQIPQPTRLDALVTMIKEHNSEKSEIKPKVVKLEKDEDEVNKFENKKDEEKRKNSSQKCCAKVWYKKGNRKREVYRATKTGRMPENMKYCMDGEVISYMCYGKSDKSGDECLDRNLSGLDFGRKRPKRKPEPKPKCLPFEST